MERIVSILLVFVGLIHIMPVSGVLGVERLSVLYGIDFGEPNLEILMRHRALLFGLLGAFLIYAGFKETLQKLAVVAGLVSVTSFILITWLVGEYNDFIHRVLMADVAALLMLVLAAGIMFKKKDQP